jgi:hypothetical protein
MNATKVGRENPAASQFVGGVLGFLFKVMPDSFFEERKKENLDILYHDEFLMTLVDEEKHRQMMMQEEKVVDFTPEVENLEESPLNMAKFVKLINYNRRFSYQGSLTTAPCAEGIMWNVVESVIPIRQATIDEFNRFRKVAEDISTDYLVPMVSKEAMD